MAASILPPSHIRDKGVHAGQGLYYLHVKEDGQYHILNPDGTTGTSSEKPQAPRTSAAFGAKNEGRAGQFRALDKANNILAGGVDGFDAPSSITAQFLKVQEARRRSLKDKLASMGMADSGTAINFDQEVISDVQGKKLAAEQDAKADAFSNALNGALTQMQLEQQREALGMAMLKEIDLENQNGFVNFLKKAAGPVVGALSGLALGPASGLASAGLGATVGSSLFGGDAGAIGPALTGFSQLQNQNDFNQNFLKAIGPRPNNAPTMSPGMVNDQFNASPLRRRNLNDGLSFNPDFGRWA